MFSEYQFFVLLLAVQLRKVGQKSRSIKKLANMVKSKESFKKDEDEKNAKDNKGFHHHLLHHYLHCLLLHHLLHLLLHLQKKKKVKYAKDIKGYMKDEDKYAKDHKGFKKDEDKYAKDWRRRPPPLKPFRPPRIIGQ